MLWNWTKGYCNALKNKEKEEKEGWKSDSIKCSSSYYTDCVVKSTWRRKAIKREKAAGLHSLQQDNNNSFSSTLYFLAIKRDTQTSIIFFLAYFPCVTKRVVAGVVPICWINLFLVSFSKSLTHYYQSGSGTTNDRMSLGLQNENENWHWN